MPERAGSAAASASMAVTSSNERARIAVALLDRDDLGRKARAHFVAQLGAQLGRRVATGDRRKAIEPGVGHLCAVPAVNVRVDERFHFRMFRRAHAGIGVPPRALDS